MAAFYTVSSTLIHTRTVQMQIQKRKKKCKEKNADYVHAPNEIRGPDTKHTDNHVWLRLITIIQVECHADLSHGLTH